MNGRSRLLAASRAGLLSSAGNSVPAARLLPAPGSTSRSRADPRWPPRRRAAEGAQHGWVLASVRRARTGTAPGQAAARPSGGPWTRPTPGRRSPAQARYKSTPQRPQAASPAAHYNFEVDTFKESYGGFYEALRQACAIARAWTSSGERGTFLLAGADPARAATATRHGCRASQQGPGRTPEDLQAAGVHHPAHSSRTDRRDRVELTEAGRARSPPQRAAGLGSALRTGPSRTTRPTRLGTARRRRPPAACPPADIELRIGPEVFTSAPDGRHAHRPPRAGTGRRRSGHHAADTLYSLLTATRP